MGGRIGRPEPKCLPVRIALMNCSTVQLPSPVSSSGVRFAEKLIPHGHRRWEIRLGVSVGLSSM